MKNLTIFGMILALWGAVLQTAQAQVQVGVSVGTGGSSFHLAIGNYYHAPPEQVAVCTQRHIPDEEMPVVFFIAAQAHVAPGVIINLRAGGMPWFNIVNQYRLNPRIFYVPVHMAMVGTPYERFYNYYYGRGPRVRLVDADFVNMVNLRFASEYYHRTPEEVIRLRAGGRSYTYIHNQYYPRPVNRNVRPNNRRGHRNDDRRDRGY